MSIVETEDRGAVRHVDPQPPREAQRASTTSWCSGCGAALAGRGGRRRRPLRRRARRGPDVLLGHGRRRPRRRWPASRSSLRASRRADPRDVEPARGDAEADDRADPRRLHRRGDGARAGLRPARDGRRRGHRPRRDARRPDPRRRRLLAAAGRRRPRPRQGDDHGLQADRRRPRRSGSAWSTAWRPPRSSTRRPTRSSASCWPARRARSPSPSALLDAVAKPALAGDARAEVAAQELCARAEDFAEGDARVRPRSASREFSGR